MPPPRVYFYCRDEEDNLQEDVITLAEGLRDLGVPYSGSCNYWRESTAPGDYLIKHDPSVRAEDCDVVVVSYTWPYWILPKTFDLVRRPLPDGLFKKGRRYATVYMDSHDGYRTVSWEQEYRQFDLILRSKLNAKAWHPSNLRPWVLGFTNRVLKATENGPAFGDRSKALLWNFGASHPYPHGTRQLAEQRFLPAICGLMEVDRTKDDLSVRPADPYEELMWRQTGYRHCRAYYHRLKGTQAVAAFCGDLIPPAPFRNPERYLVGGNRARLRRAAFEFLSLFDPRPRRAVQWDSFRFWEALVAGCATFNLDLDRFGVVLPVMPVNWKHYIGVDLAKMQQVTERLREEPALLESIAAEGRSWAMQNYSPRQMAIRFLGALGLRPQSSAVKR